MTNHVTAPIITTPTQSSLLTLTPSINSTVSIIPIQSSQFTINNLIQRQLLVVNISNGSSNLVTLPIFINSKKARKDGLKRRDLYFDYNVQINIIKRRITNFIFNFSSNFTYIGKM